MKRGSRRRATRRVARRHPPRRKSRLRVWLAGAVLLALAPALARADGTEIHWSGLFDMALAQRGQAYDLNVLTRGDASFDAYGVRLFANAAAGDRLKLDAQVVLREASGFYVEGAYATFTPSPANDLHLLAGKVPWAIGTYAPRSYSNHNPLIATPLMYQYHSTLVWYKLPPNADALLGTAGSGQYGIDYAGSRGGRGMAMVDDSFWDVGMTLTGSRRPFEYALGMTMGTPGWAVTSEDDNSGRNYLGRVGFSPVPSFRIGASAAYGPYLEDALDPQLPAGKTATDYHQRLTMADLEVLTGHLELRSEGAWNVWETPTLGNLPVTSGYAEVKYSLSMGAYLAGRLDAIRFGKIKDSSGAERTWDANVTRIEAGIGYRFSRTALVKLVYQHDQLEYDGPAEHYDRPSLVAAQFSVMF